MAIGDHYELVLKSACLGEDFRNVIHYVMLAGSGDWTDLATQWATDIESPLEAVLSNQWTASEIEVINLDDPTDYGSLSISWVGDYVAGVPGTLPGWVAWSFKKNRTSREFRNGSIRFSGISEAATDGLDPNATALTELTTLGTALSADVVDLGGNEFRMVIRSLPNLTYPTTRYNEISSVTFNKLTSQVSRRS